MCVREKSSSYLRPSRSAGRSALRRKLQLLPLEHLGDVEVEEVAVQDRLDGPGEDRNQVVVSLGVVSVDPVEQVQRTVRSEGKQVVAGDAFRLARFADQEQLRQDGHRLQIDRERPQNLQRGKRGVDQQRQHEARNQQELDAERVVVVVVRGLKLDVHHVQSGHRRHDKDQLHNRVVHAHERRHQVQIAGNVHDREQNLRLAGDSGARPRLPYFYQQQNNRQKM